MIFINKQSNTAHLVLVIIFLAGLCNQSVYGIGRVQSYVVQKQSVLFYCENNDIVKLSVCADDVLRVQVSDKDDFKPTLMEELGYVKTSSSPTDFKVEDLRENYIVSTSKLRLRVYKSQFGFQLTDSEGKTVLASHKGIGFKSGKANVLSFDMPADEHFFGFGFMRETLDARGHKLSFRREYRWKGATLPFFMSTRGYAFYSNNIFNQDFDFTTKTDNGIDEYYSVTSNGGKIDFFLIYGPDFPRLLDRYTDLTGKSMLVPKWAFGLEYRLRYYGDQDELLSVAKEFRNKEIPCDIMALEPGWEDVAYSMDWKWSPERFPNPRKMIAELADMGFKMDLWESGVAPTEGITNKKTRVKWYEQRKEVVDMGVRMFKQDDPYPRSIVSSELLDPVFARKKFKDKKLSAEELNNVANTLYTETLFNEFRKQTNERAVVMFHAYNASVASHRWPFQWAGDFQAENGMLNASLSGHAMVSYDIRNPYAAGWHQGFFTPFSVVDAWAYYREPWLYSESIEQSHRIYACLRSRLVPYLYSSLWQSHKTGLPIERPMVLNYNDDPMTHNMKSQFMIGDWFLLALSDVDDSPGGEKIDFWTGSQKGNNGRIYLPEGKWVNYWNGEEKNIKHSKWVYGDWPEYLGGLLYVKAGAIIPMGQTKNYIGETSDEVVVLDVYPDEVSSYQLYEDDGISYEYENEAHALTDIKCEKRDSKVSLSILKRKGNYKNMPQNRTFLVKMHALFKPTQISVDGRPLDNFTDPSKLIHSEKAKGWYYDADAKKAIIKLDEGWSYALKSADHDPLSTIPLTAKYERIKWAKEFAVEEKDRLVEMLLPTKAIPLVKLSIASLPADERSMAICSVNFDNVKENVGEFNVDIKGAARLCESSSHFVYDERGSVKFSIISGATPGIATMTISGRNIESQVLEIPIYGEPVRLELDKSETVLVADGENLLKLNAHLYDKGGRLVPNAATPVIVRLKGTAIFQNNQKTDTVYVVNGSATTFISSSQEGDIMVSANFKGNKSNTIFTRSEQGRMQVRINPPEKVKLDSDGGWIPDQVDVFVNFKAGQNLISNSKKVVTLNVYSKAGKLLDTYVQSAKKGEVIFKDISYYKRPAQCLFEIKSEGFETVSRKVFANTWDVDPKKKSLK